MNKDTKSPVETDPLLGAVPTTPSSINRWMPHSATEVNGLLWMTLSALLYPIPTVLVRVAFLHFDFPASAAMILRSGSQFLFSSILLLTIFRKSLVSLSPQNQAVLFLRGTLGCIGLIAYYKALTYLPAGEVTAVFAFTPVLTMLLAKLILKEENTLWDVVCSILGIVGVWLIACPNGGGENMLGVLLVLISIFSSSFAYICVRGMGSEVHFMLCVFAFGAIAFPTTSYLGGHNALHQIFTNHKGTGIILLGSLWGFLAQCCLNRGLQLCNAGEGVIMMNLEVPTGYFLGLWLLGEKPSFLRIVGSTLVVSAVIMVGMRRLMKS
ncbi:EamA-like transporter [Gracilaria domingensis]|nr:EamA-like transporter [Gracilaria domingensis]